MSKGIRYPRRVEGPFQAAEQARDVAQAIRDYPDDEPVPIEARESISILLDDLASLLEILARENIGYTYKSD